MMELNRLMMLNACMTEHQLIQVESSICVDGQLSGDDDNDEALKAPLTKELSIQNT